MSEINFEQDNRKLSFRLRVQIFIWKFTMTARKVRHYREKRREIREALENLTNPVYLHHAEARK